LHQAPKAWYATLSTFLEEHGYRRGTIDKTLFIKKVKKDIMLVQVYVDDIIFGSTRKFWCDEFEALMKCRFQMSSMGELIFFLGLHVKQKTDGIFISQDNYVANMLKKFDLASVKTKITPMETKMALTKDKEADEVDVHLYISLIGHIEIRHHFIRDSYKKKLIRVEKIHTDNNVADMLTKVFDGPRFKSGRPMLILTVTVITLDNGEQELKATIDTHEYIISESSVRNKLKLADENGITEFTNAENFKGMANMGIDTLKKELKENKQTTAAIIVKLVKKVKKLETRVKYGNLPNRKMFLSDSESEDAANSSKQGRNLGEEDVFETPKGKDSGESGLKKKLDVGVSSGDRKFKSASEEIKSGFINISSGEIREEEASLAEIARIQAQEAAKIERKAKLQRLDALAAKRLNDEFEMSEQQRKRAAEVQQQAQYYTEEDWDLIRARMEASTELRKSVFGTDIDAEDYAKKMVELVEKRRKGIRETII
ncbi:putative ribonuclease H-like domain-containing protein, partial [Tanacetum coccineum]